MPIYMKYDGITGQVTTDGFKDQVMVESFQFGVNRAMTSGAKNANREASTPSVSEVVITKTQDAASADIVKTSLGGEGKKCIFSFTKSGTDMKEAAYMIITLEHTLISSFNMSSHGEGIPNESLSLNFTKIEYKMMPSDPKNKTAAPKVATFDILTGKGG